MPKVIQMPRRTPPAHEDHAVRRSAAVRDGHEESESIAKIQRWLEMADAALQKQDVNKKRA